MSVLRQLRHALLANAVLFAFATSSSHAALPDLRDYYVVCDPDSLAYIIENAHEDIYIACEFVYEGDVWHDARLRLRGSSSRDYPKKSFKVNFDANERFFGRDKLNLNSEWTDATFSREYLSYELFRRAGLQASQVWFARLNINGEYMGLYADIEHVDEIFLARTGLNQESSVYKASLDGSMLRASENLDSLWEKETNEDTGFYDLYDLVQWIDTVPDDRFYDELGQVFDREQVARHMAVNTFIGNSSTWYHNYFVVHDLRPGGKWRLLPWDLDRTLYFWGVNNSLPEYYRCSHLYMEEVNALIARCWTDDSMRANVFRHVREIATTLVTLEYYNTITQHLDTLLTAAVLEDERKQYDLAQFHADLAALPAEIVERRDYLAGAVDTEPFPFLQHPAFATPDGIHLSWDRCVRPDGAPVEYQVRIDTDFRFPAPTFYYPGTDTSLVLSNEPGETWYWRVDALNGGSLFRQMQFYERIETPFGLDNATELSGELTSDLTLSVEDNPVWITANLVIPEERTLTFEPGVRVGIAADAVLTVEGKLTVAAADSDSVLFTSLLSGEPMGEVHFIGLKGISSLANLVIEATYGGGTIRLTGSQNLNLDDCRLLYPKSTAIQAEWSALRIQHTRIESAEATAIIFNGQIFDLIGSEFVDRSDDAEHVVVQCTAGNVQVTGSTFHGLAGTLFSGSGVVNNGIVVSNSVFSGGNRGIALDDSTQAWVQNTEFTQFDTAMVALDDVYLQAFNNVISRCDVGVSILGAAEDQNPLTKVANTVFYQTSVPLVHMPDYRVQCFYSFSDATEVSWPGLVTGDPGVLDAWNGNWTLLGSSPLIDAGWGTGHPGTDRNGQIRVDTPSIPNTGGGSIDYVDIGLYEYTAGFVPEPVELNEDYLVVYPNPASGPVAVAFEVRYPLDAVTMVEYATLTVHNLLGQRLRKIVRPMDFGRQEILWDGCDENGNPVASGMYFITLKRGTREQTIRVVQLH